MTEMLAPPDDALETLLPPDLSEDPSSWRHPAALDVWYGVVWSRLGRGDLAWAWWDAVEADALRPWIHAERGRVLRELGLHTEAQVHDGDGLAMAIDPVDIAMLRLGLAADAIGLGHVEAAVLRLDAASTIVDALEDSPRAARQRLRRSWVEVELAIAEGRTPEATALPDYDVETGVLWPDDYAHGTVFHRAKGLLFAGIARRDADLLDEAAAMAPPVLAWAVELARADAGDEDAMARARDTWERVVPPPGFEEAVARTPTVRRLTEDETTP